mgnify:CR=1 FL=1
MTMDKRPQEFDSQHRCEILKKVIEEACIMLGLNLCIYDGKIGFVDQEERKIVGLWKADHDLPGEECHE